MRKTILFLFASFCLTAAHSQSKSQMSNRVQESSIPKDILDTGYVLLVKLPYDNKTWIKKFTNLMEEHYTGKFEVVLIKHPFRKLTPIQRNIGMCFLSPIL